jgi:type I restriction enzyme M protein
LEDSANLPAPEAIAQEIVEDLEAALAEFAQVARSLRETQPSVSDHAERATEPGRTAG